MCPSLPLHAEQEEKEGRPHHGIITDFQIAKTMFLVFQTKEGNPSNLAKQLKGQHSDLFK